MYFSKAGNYTVTQANLDGTGAVSLGNLNGLVHGIADLALDLQAGKMYLVDYNSCHGTVTRANLDGTGAVNLGNLSGLVNCANGIALDPALGPNGSLFVVNDHNVIMATMDGTGAVDLANLNNT